MFKTINYGIYNDNFGFSTLPKATSSEVDGRFNYGVTKNIEVQAYVPYINNVMEGRKAGNLGDTTITVARQLHRQQGNKWPPNIKFIFRQLFPTGRYDELQSELFATDATGQGSYLTTLALNTEHVSHLASGHSLVLFSTVGVILPSRMSLNGRSIYGGGPLTSGTLWPGNKIIINLALNYSPDDNWGFIMESYIFTQGASRFHGRIGPTTPRFQPSVSFPFIVRHTRHTRHEFRRIAERRIIFNNLLQNPLNLGGFEGIGHGDITSFNLIPAVNFSFTDNLHMTGGFWFTVAGKNIPASYTPMVRFSANW